MFKFVSNFCVYVIFFVVFVKVWYLVFIVDIVMVDWSLFFYKIGVFLNFNNILDVDFCMLGLCI